MPEPAPACCLGIALAGIPKPAILNTGTACGSIFFPRVHSPIGFAGNAILIAYPASLAAYAPHHTIFCKAVNFVTQIGDIVINITVNVDSSIASAIISVPSVCAVKPHFKLVIAILGEFFALLYEHSVYVVLCAVILTVSVPRRNIETVFHSEFAGRFAKHLGNVGLSAVIGTVAYVMRCGGCGPEAKTVVVFHNGNAAFHPRFLTCREPLLGIRNPSGSKSSFTLISVTPLVACVGVHAVVEETVEFGFVPKQLPFARHGVNRCGFVVRVLRHLRFVQSQLSRAPQRKHQRAAKAQIV